MELWGGKIRRKGGRRHEFFEGIFVLWRCHQSACLLVWNVDSGTVWFGGAESDFGGCGACDWVFERDKRGLFFLYGRGQVYQLFADSGHGLPCNSPL